MTFLLLSLALLQAASPASDPFDVEFSEVAPGVVVAQRPDPLRDPVVGNVTILINDRDVVLVDAGASPRTAHQILEEVRRRTDLPISTPMLTHGHEDHVLGTEVFRAAYPGLRVVTRRGTRDYLAPDGPVARRLQTVAERIEGMRAAGLGELEALRREGAAPELLRYLERRWGPDLEAAAREKSRVRLVEPDEVFEGVFEIFRGKRTIRLLDLGPGKSGSATVVHLPEERIVMAGDVVVAPVPYGFARDPAGWIATLKAVERLGPRTIIPGHGPPLSGSEYLDRVIALAEFVRQGVEEGLARGLDGEAVSHSLDFMPWVREFAGTDPIREHLFHEWFIEPAVARAISAAGGS
ncbi:MAG: MBL fold metallo-hydrolase [Acidobacteria bacterium]|nr:MBL fold metallo-hydrolase [Acidobacteriota bacterium]